MHERHTPPTHRPLCWFGWALMSPQHTSRPKVPLHGIETTKKNTQKFFQICMSNIDGSLNHCQLALVKTWQCKHFITQAFSLHSVLTLMTSKCGWVWKQWLCPREFYIGQSPEPRGCGTIAGKGWEHPIGPIGILTFFFFRKQSVVHWAIHKRFLTSRWMVKTLFLAEQCQRHMRSITLQGTKSHLKAAWRLWPV